MGTPPAPLDNEVDKIVREIRNGIAENEVMRVDAPPVNAIRRHYQLEHDDGEQMLAELHADLALSRVCEQKHNRDESLKASKKIPVTPENCQFIIQRNRRKDCEKGMFKQLWDTIPYYQGTVNYYKDVDSKKTSLMYEDTDTDWEDEFYAKILECKVPNVIEQQNKNKKSSKLVNPLSELFNSIAFKRVFVQLEEGWKEKGIGARNARKEKKFWGDFQKFFEYNEEIVRKKKARALAQKRRRAEKKRVGAGMVLA